MLDNIGFKPETISLSTSTLLIKIPAPSGSTLEHDTQTYDYDQNCFFIQSYESALIINSEEKINLIAKLHKELNKSLIMVAIDNVLDWYINFLENNEYFNMLNEGMIIFPENSTYSKPFQFVKYDENISQEILQICDIWGIRDYLFLAIDLIKAHFPTFQDINITFDKDQEVDEEWLTLDVTIKGEIDEILDEYDKYSENFIYSVPWPERDKIRLSYDIV